MFLYNGEQSYSYADLLKAVCMDDYVPLLKTHDLFKYFSNLIKALVNNKPLVLLDSDLSLSELGGINEEKINVIEKLRTQKFSSMDEVVKALQQSASERYLLREQPDSPKRSFIVCRDLPVRYVVPKGINGRFGPMPIILHTWQDCKCSFKPLKTRILW